MARKPTKGLRTSAFWASISKHMKRAEKEKLQRAMLTQLRNGTLHSGLRGFVADELELFWFPSPHREREHSRKAKAYAYIKEVEHLMEKKGLSKKRAEAKVVALYKLKSVAALKQFLKRVKREDYMATARR
jgi:hypothetical protein